LHPPLFVQALESLLPAKPVEPIARDEAEEVNMMIMSQLGESVAARERLMMTATMVDHLATELDVCISSVLLPILLVWGCKITS